MEMDDEPIDSLQEWAGMKKVMMSHQEATTYNTMHGPQYIWPTFLLFDSFTAFHHHSK